MKQINTLVSLYSLIALVVVFERLSKITEILLDPYHFIRLHELNQTVLFLGATIVISVLILKLTTNNFQTLKEKGNTFLLILFILGAYLYGAGEGWHEVASFTLHTYCNMHQIIGNLCGGLYINDYYAGNIIFFIGAVMMNYALLAFSVQQPVKNFTRKDMSILLINSIIYAFTWIKYAAYDEVLVGLFFSTLLMFLSFWFVFKIKNKFAQYPYVTYSLLAYVIATIATILIKFH